MKKNLKNLLFIPLFAVILMLGNTSCKDDTDCNMEILVKLDSDTTAVVPNAIVHVHQGETHVWGVTDASGKYNHTFALEAIFVVSITDSTIIDSTTTPPLYLVRLGEGTVRLKPGETIKKTIFVK
ncbi:MAG: hypothetical protein ACOYO1_09005 [Bacteroidales bacterium]